MSFIFLTKQIVCLSYIFCYQFQIPKISEMDYLLKAVCRTFRLPLAQYWITAYPAKTLRVVHQFSHEDFENIAPWCQFKRACLQRPLNICEGLVGNTYLSYQACFCRDITKLRINHYPFTHYAQNCGSVACFTICLHSLYLGKKSVLEFFLPYQEIDRNYPQTLLNSLLATINEHRLNCMLASRKQLGQVFTVKVINSSTHNKPDSFKIGQHYSSLPHHEGSEYTRILNFLEDGTEHGIC